MNRILAFFFLSSFVFLSSLAINKQDFVDLYDQFNGDQWIDNGGWKKSDDPCDGTWFGVTCQPTPLGPAALLSLPYNNLQGTFPPSISNIQLGFINLTGNKIKGELPSFWVYINAIILSNNQLRGGIPPSYRTYTLLLTLELNNNFLSQEIPSDLFSNLRAIRKVDLGSNLFSGKIPDSIGSIGASLESLNLQNNRLVGFIPDSICNNVKLREMSLNINVLVGSIPECIGALSSLQFLRLDSNALSGGIPSGVFKLTNLQALILNNNNLSGNLSSDLSALKELLVFSIAFNSISGNLPETEPLLNLLAYQVNYNNFTGGIPESISNYTSLKLLDLSHNRLEGNIPVSFFLTALNITTLLLNNNNFSGELSNELGNLVNLQIIDVSWNRFNGTIPNQFGNIPFISTIILAHNDFSGEILTTFRAFSALSYIDYSYNRLSGRLTANIQFLTQLKTALFNNNQLTGSIPPDIVYLQLLERVNLANNLLDGGMPTAAGYLTSLIELDVTNNSVVGELPPSLSGMKSLQILRLGNNQITSTSIEGLGQLSELRVLDLGDNLINATLPDSFRNLLNLRTLSIPNNRLYGEIPQGFFELRNLQEINLSGNLLTGGVASLRSDPSLFDISNNYFSGSTAFLSDLSSVQEMRLSYNRFDSTIPDLLHLKKLRIFEAKQNQFSGKAPEISQLTVLEVLDLSDNSFDGKVPSMAGDVNLRVLNLQNNKFSEGSAVTPLPSLVTCDMSSNPFQCPITSQSSLQCRATCTYTPDPSTDSVRMRIEGDVSSFDKDKFLIGLSRAVNTSVSRFEILSITPGSVILDIKVYPPSQGQENEGSASRVVYRIKNTEGSVYSAQGIEVISFSDVPVYKKELGKGAIAGIVIGVVVFVAILAGLIAFFLILRKRRQEREDIEMEKVRQMDRLMLDNITIDSIIGSGQFGKVYKADWNGTQVAMKGMKTVDDDDTKWKEEIILLQKLNHPNVVRFLGVNKMEGILYMVLEFAEKGSLDHFLYKEENTNVLTTSDLLRMVFDITNGMIYLVSKNVVHRDLAARNVLLDASLHCKISDFGLSEEQTNEEGTVDQMPYRWSAPEMIQHKKSSFASDVWSFGVVMWEIFNLGGIPYKAMVNKDVVTFVLGGGRLEQPVRCPQEVYAIMLKCWCDKPEDRPSFDAIRAEILSKFPNLLKDNNGSINMNQFTTTGGDFYASSQPIAESNYKFTDESAPPTKYETIKE
eukprot:TRINITY_DN5799_c0_g1_i1.p1 TRINITY_DN5799_c0_g1~~TRINITY_DN5799_c0_g1_i1.p1  ORF type:complete len:1220 (+),score=385.00 TRINITY_DN5799_c0_g1_i1:201-3860(+)